MPVGGPAFSSVRKAKEALKERAHEFLNMYIDGMKRALDGGDYETFQKGMAYILSHIPADEGERLFEIDVDKPKQVESGPKGPAIQIGVQIGGLQKALPSADLTIIDIEPSKDTSSNS